jgi:hypothetical protein
MIKVETTLIEIKKTKSVEMYHDTVEGGLWLEVIHEYNAGGKTFIPLSKLHQVLRGLITEDQKFYRKHLKK